MTPTIDRIEELEAIARAASGAEWVARPLRENDFEHFAIGEAETETGFAIIGYVDRLTAVQKRDHIVAFQPSEVLSLLAIAKQGLRNREALELLEFMCSWIVSKGFDGSTSERALPGEYDTAMDLIAKAREAERGPA